MTQQMVVFSGFANVAVKGEAVPNGTEFFEVFLGLNGFWVASNDTN